MFSIRIAELNIHIHNRFEEIREQCSLYFCDGEHADISVSPTAKDIAYEKMIAGGDFSDGYLETLAVYRAIGEQLPLFDGFIFHAAVIEFDGKAYAFAAKSGTGKSTHIRHWRTVLGNAVSPVNGDKPIFRFMNGALYACGTPWAGKEGWQRNVCVPLAGICFLERGSDDQIKPISSGEGLIRALSQIYLPADRNTSAKTMQCLDQMLKSVPLWHLQCTNSIHAATVASNAMLKKQTGISLV